MMRFIPLLVLFASVISFADPHELVSPARTDIRPVGTGEELSSFVPVRDNEGQQMIESGVADLSNFLVEQSGSSILTDVPAGSPPYRL